MQEVAFFECPSCFRQYAMRNGGVLTYRWGHPISLALYGIMFKSQPLDAAQTISELLARDRKAAEMVALIAEIEWELEHPTQQVSEILEVAASESECREFLAVLARKLKESVPLHGGT